MQEKVLEVLSGITLPEETDEPEFDEGKLQTFLTAHKNEVFEIIDKLPSTSVDESEFEFPYQRFVTLLDNYQEQPTFLDCCLNDIVTKLLSYIHFLDDGQTKLDRLSSCAFKFLSHLSKVRGYKPFLTYLPHDVLYLEKVLSSLERLSDDFHASYVLLLWMVIVCKNPFSLNRFAPNAKDPLHTARRVINVALAYLSRPVDRCHPVAAMLLSITVCRAETCSVLLPSLVKDTASTLQECGEKSSVNNKLIGNLYLLVAIFKQGQRKDLVPLAPSVLLSLDFARHMDDDDFVVKKLVTKLVQRLGMVFLKPKVALWRYNRGNRILTFDDQAADKIHNLRNGEEEELSGQDGYVIPEKELEFVLDVILKSLRDCDTGVRWSAAKGVGRIASRLPKNLAEDVVRSILCNNFNDVSGQAAWHGGCLAIAELARRGYLAVNLLPEVIEMLKKALVYEEPRGRHALGANVRDAACYIAWALARAFRPSDLTQYMEEIAAALICVALFDREINVRRAASAAFQENVGRQGTFPNGIEILTRIDFFAVGQRNRAYVEIACEIAQYSQYTLPIIQHLLTKKVCHWDEKLRFLAAESLRRLAQKHGGLVYDQVPKYVLPLLNHKFPAQRQGGILAFSGILSGLYTSGFELKNALLTQAAEVPTQSYSLCEKKSRIAGGILIRRAINTFIRLLAPVIPLSLIPIKDWLKAVELNILDDNEDMRIGAGKAAANFFDFFKSPNYVKELAVRVTEQYLPKFIHSDTETHRQGFALLLSCLNTTVLFFTCNGTQLFEQIISKLASVIEKRSSSDSLWAFGRQSSLEAMTGIALKVGVNTLQKPELFVECILNAMDDYTISRKGDVGRFLRESSMRSLCFVIPQLEDKRLQVTMLDKAVCKVVRQSCEKIDAVRVCAAEVMCKLLCCGACNIVERELLYKVYLRDAPYGYVGDPSPYMFDDWRLKGCFSRLALLVTSSYYSYWAVSGFVISAGGLTESTRRNAAEALFTVLAQYTNSLQFMEDFLHSLGRIIAESDNNRRVTVPLLCFLDQLFDAQLLTLFESDPDSSPSLKVIVRFLIEVAKLDSNCRSARLAVDVLCHFIQFNKRSLIWREAVSVVIDTLHCRYPLLRSNAAEKLYESLAAECTLEDEIEQRGQLLSILADTNWQAELKNDVLCKAAESVANFLNVS